MGGRERGAEWGRLSEGVFSQIEQWRREHPKATFEQIEAAVDERLAEVRVRVLEDAVLASEVADPSDAEPNPTCGHCGLAMERRGTPGRRLLTDHNRSISLERAYFVCPSCGEGLFPPG